jgi:radical SAM superfamily enzyme YgiQ (UPF0313 family)
MKVLIVQLPHTDRVPTMFPLGLGYIASALNELNVEVEVLDIFALRYSRQDVETYLGKRKWDLVGISAFSTQYEWAKWMAAVAKKKQPQSVLVMGGPLPTFNSEIVLQKTPTDVCVIGEGEETVKDLLQNMGDFINIKGIVYKTESGCIATTAPRPYIKNIDDLKPPRYDIFPMEAYFNNMGSFGSLPVKTINIITSRGCPFSCNFCSKTFSGVRLRSIDNVIEEIGWLRDKYGIRGVSFGDELVLSSKQRAYELCEKIKPLKVYWSCQGRANNVDLSLLKTMRNSGCTGVGYGIESCSQKILDAMNKKVSTIQNEMAIVNTLKAGMVPVAQMIYGYPGENFETILETIEFFKRVHYYPPCGEGEAHFNLLVPLPGSPLYNKLLEDYVIIDEENYLLGLDMGYYPNCPIKLNLTDLSDVELMAYKQRLSNTVKLNHEKYLKKHPMIRLKKYYNIITLIYKIEGIIGVAHHSAQSLIRRLHRHFLRN